MNVRWSFLNLGEELCPAGRDRERIIIYMSGSETKIIRTTTWSAGPGCHGGCGVLAHIKDGKLVKLEGDPDHPWNHGPWQALRQGPRNDPVYGKPASLEETAQAGGKKGRGDPDPLVEIHPETAAERGIGDGEWVWVENWMGRARFKAKLTLVTPRWMVMATHAWWMPEKKASEPTLYGTWEHNINMLMPMAEQGKDGLGTPLKHSLCRIYKAAWEEARIGSE